MFANHPVRTALSTLRRGLAASSPIEQGWQASGVRRGVEALGAFREDFAAVFGNADRMFDLGGEGAVAGDGSPAVVEHRARGLADVRSERSRGGNGWFSRRNCGGLPVHKKNN